MRFVTVAAVLSAALIVFVQQGVAAGFAPDTSVRGDIVTRPDPRNFSICHRDTCAIVSLFGWPHTTAMVSETRGGARWAVDSWFRENGKPPEIVPLEVWRRGWRPGKPPVAVSPK